MLKSHGVEKRAMPPTRYITRASLSHGRTMVPIHGLLQIDVTDLREALAATDPPLSFTAFVIASVARAVAEDPRVHGYTDWRGRLVVHHAVDVATIVESEAPGERFPAALLVRNADTRSVAEISEEIRHASTDRGSGPWHRITGSPLMALARIPGLLRGMFALAARSVWLRRRVGTVAVTAVGMFGGGGGHGIPAPTIHTLSVVVGGIAERPWVVDGRVEPREVLDLTVTTDHRLVDGAPATRFAARLRRSIEAAEALHEA